MKTIGLTLAALASLTATGALAQAQDDTVAYTHRKPQMLVTGSSFRNIVLFGAGGGFLVDRIEGPHIARKYDVRDPQDDIAYAVASELAARRGDALADAPVDISGLSRRELARNPPPARYLVDVESTKRELMWSLFRGQWTKYTVGYRADLSVLDIPNQKYVVKDRCVWSTPKSERASRRRMLADGAGQLKAQFDIAADACTTQFVGATQDLWRADRRPVAYEQAPPQIEQRIERRAEPAYYGPPPSAYAERRYEASTSTYTQQGYEASRSAEYGPARPSAPPPRAVIDASRAQHPARPAVVEYGYARSYEAPPARAAVTGGVDASGYLAWPSKRP